MSIDIEEIFMAIVSIVILLSLIPILVGSININSVFNQNLVTLIYIIIIVAFLTKLVEFFK